MPEIVYCATMTRIGIYKLLVNDEVTDVKKENQINVLKSLSMVSSSHETDDKKTV